MFENLEYEPMIASQGQTAFDESDYYYEPDLEGVRCLAYLDKDKTVLKHSGKSDLTSHFPELKELHKEVLTRCVLDGELTVFSGGLPDYEATKKRILPKQGIFSKWNSQMKPATFIVYDVLFHDNEDVTSLSLHDRKAVLQPFISENSQIVINRTECKGQEFLKAVKAQGLEGVVAKRKKSRYHPGALTKDWVKIKPSLDEDLLVCGFVRKSRGKAQLILGLFNDHNGLEYQGQVSIATNKDDFKVIESLPRASRPLFTTPLPKSTCKATWFKPELTIRVSFMSRKPNGVPVQPLFKELRL